MKHATIAIALRSVCTDHVVRTLEKGEYIVPITIGGHQITNRAWPLTQEYALGIILEQPTPEVKAAMLENARHNRHGRGPVDAEDQYMLQACVVTRRVGEINSSIEWIDVRTWQRVAPETAAAIGAEMVADVEKYIDTMAGLTHTGVKITKT